MRLAVDTNVLLRVILRDDPVQAAQAEVLLTRADPLAISVLALCELVWVLSRTYHYDRAEIAKAVEALTKGRKVETDRLVVKAGLAQLRAGGDFADGCMIELARAQRCRLASFDKKFIRRSGGAVSDAAELALTS